MLLENNASIDGALAFAARKGQLETARFLLDNGSRATERWALSAAVVSGNVDVVRLLLENGADPDGDGYWNTPLIIAAEGHDWNIFQLLLEHNADPQVRNRRGYTVVDFARRTQCYGIVGGIIRDVQSKK
jgi:ankyrin repeat protein